jgi:hypothetical protein
MEYLLQGVKTLGETELNLNGITLNRLKILMAGKVNRQSAGNESGVRRQEDIASNGKTGELSDPISICMILH